MHAPRSTLVGDIAEVKAIKKVFTDTKHLKVNGTKSMIGHCLGAAAGVEAIATLKVRRGEGGRAGGRGGGAGSVHSRPAWGVAVRSWTRERGGSEAVAVAG